MGMEGGKGRGREGREGEGGKGGGREGGEGEEMGGNGREGGGRELLMCALRMYGVQAPGKAVLLQASHIFKSSQKEQEVNLVGLATFRFHLPDKM